MFLTMKIDYYQMWGFFTVTCGILQQKQRKKSQNLNAFKKVLNTTAFIYIIKLFAMYI